jgi:hypothetical protein
MSVVSTAATSRRGYLSQDELAQFANITVNDETEANDVISQAEEMIDAFVGAQNSFFGNPLTGRAYTGSSSTLTLETAQQNIYDVDYFALCEVEIIGGTGAGQRKKITGSTKAGVLTVDSAFSTPPNSTSFYRIYQLGKFPRKEDVTYYSTTEPIAFYKQIPEAIKRAVAAQVEYIIQMDDDYFSTNKGNIQSESLGDYSYTISGAGTNMLIAPKAKMLLRGIVNRTGTIVA